IAYHVQRAMEWQPSVRSTQTVGTRSHVCVIGSESCRRCAGGAARGRGPRHERTQEKENRRSDFGSSFRSERCKRINIALGNRDGAPATEGPKEIIALAQDR